MRTEALNPWDELRLVDRPSIFLLDPYFRARNSKGTIQSEEGLGYKLFGTYTQARQPNKQTRGSTRTCQDQSPPNPY
jgi:hypothetical protein